MSGYDELKPNPYFGEDWSVPATEGADQVPTPVGEKCLYCREKIVEGDQGYMMGDFSRNLWGVVPVHKECQFRQVVGGLAHQHHVCSCHGGKPEDDPAKDMTKREEAIAVWEWVQVHGIR